jgi:hypothetical protein
MPVTALAAELITQAGGQVALGGQIVLQGQDAQGRGQVVALVEQLPDPPANTS